MRISSIIFVILFHIGCGTPEDKNKRDASESLDQLLKQSIDQFGKSLNEKSELEVENLIEKLNNKRKTLSGTENESSISERENIDAKIKIANEYINQNEYEDINENEYIKEIKLTADKILDDNSKQIFNSKYNSFKNEQVKLIRKFREKLQNEHENEKIEAKLKNFEIQDKLKLIEDIEKQNKEEIKKYEEELKLLNTQFLPLEDQFKDKIKEAKTISDFEGLLENADEIFKIDNYIYYLNTLIQHKKNFLNITLKKIKKSIDENKSNQVDSKKSKIEIENSVKDFQNIKIPDTINEAQVKNISKKLNKKKNLSQSQDKSGSKFQNEDISQPKDIDIEQKIKDLKDLLKKIKTSIDENKSEQNIINILEQNKNTWFDIDIPHQHLFINKLFRWSVGKHKDELSKYIIKNSKYLFGPIFRKAFNFYVKNKNHKMIEYFLDENLIKLDTFNIFVILEEIASGYNSRNLILKLLNKVKGNESINLILISSFMLKIINLKNEIYTNEVLDIIIAKKLKFNPYDILVELLKNTGNLFSEDLFIKILNKFSIYLAYPKGFDQLFSKICENKNLDLVKLLLSEPYKSKINQSTFENVIFDLSLKKENDEYNKIFILVLKNIDKFEKKLFETVFNTLCLFKNKEFLKELINFNKNKNIMESKKMESTLKLFKQEEMVKYL